MSTAVLSSGPLLWPIRQLVPVAGRLQHLPRVLSTGLPATWSVATMQPLRPRSLGCFSTHALCEIGESIATGTQANVAVRLLMEQNVNCSVL